MLAQGNLDADLLDGSVGRPERRFRRRGPPQEGTDMFGIGLREFLLIAFILVLVFGLRFWMRVGNRLVRMIRDRFNPD
ncbi:MAG: twin-arginine translocase TatA/TatE family subunit [Candidatus Krumholzibacteriia bacterium]